MADGLETLAQLAAQHRAILEQHERWLARATTASVQGLVEENGSLRRELAALKAFVGQKFVGKKPPLPCLPVALKGGRGGGVNDPKMICSDSSTSAIVQGLGGHGVPRPHTQPPLSDPARQFSNSHPKRSSSCPHGNASAAKAQPTACLQPSTRSPSPSSSSGDGLGREQADALPGMVTAEAWERGDLEPERPSGSKSCASFEEVPVRKVHGSMTQQQFALIDSKTDTRELRRMRIMLGLGGNSEEASVEDVAACLSTRMKSNAMTASWLEQTLGALDRSREVLTEKVSELGDTWLCANSMVSLAGLTLLRGPHAEELVSLCPPETCEGARLIVAALNVTMLDEVLLEATKTTPAQKHTVTSIVKGARENYVFSLNVAVACMVVFNVLSLGVSIDRAPDHMGWFTLEAVCCVVFVVEASLKMYWQGSRDYFTGAARYWNIGDLTVTLISLTELCFSIYSLAVPVAAIDTGTKVTSAARAAVIVRALRVARIFSLMKLLHSPILRDLANMLVGIVIGIPSLFWVMVFFGFVLYLLGLVFRMSLGPLQGQDLIGGGCGYGDDRDDFLDDVCKVHYLYGEEFFGTISKSMFTAFRFMLGDYSTRAGKSLVVAFSAGYGVPFDTVFVSFMILVIFGLFNIITAIFVDSTISGLKHNDIKRKYARQYEAEFVKTKLKALMDRVWHLQSAGARASDASDVSCPDDVSNFYLTEEDFIEIMEDAVIHEVLADLDISVYNPAGIFDTFDPDCDGRVTVSEFIQAIIKLRGEPQKNDIIACFVSLRSMQDKIDSISRFLKFSMGPDAASGRKVATASGGGVQAGAIRPSLSSPELRRLGRP